VAGKPAPRDVLIDVEKLRRLYYDERPDPNDPQPRVAFGQAVTSVVKTAVTSALTGPGSWLRSPCSG
jgi:hypothetical protein